MGRTDLLTDAEREKIPEGHVRGVSASALAHELGRSTSTISRAALAMGLRFDGSRTEAATAAASAEAAARRAEISGRLLDEATSSLDDLHRPYTAFAFAQSADPEMRYVEHPVMPQPADKAQLTRASSAAIAEHCRLAKLDADAAKDDEAIGYDPAVVTSLADRLTAYFASGRG